MKNTVVLFFFLLSIAIANAQMLMVNEVSQGIEGAEEYVEIVVVGTPDCSGFGCADMRGWYIDDNSGYFNNGAGSGIAAGCIRLADVPQWACIPVGTIILIYNDLDYNASIIPPVDETDSNGDCVYVIPVSSSLLESHDTEPNTTNNSFPTTGFNVGGVWSDIGMKNGDDSFQILDPNNLTVPYFSISWGNNTNNTQLYFATDAGGLVMFFANTNSDDYFLQTNWEVQPTLTHQTPGLPNNPANQAWILSMNNNCSPIVPPVADGGPDAQIPCGGGSVQLDAGASTGNLLEFLWSGPGLIAGEDTENPTVNMPGTYIVTVTDLVGCTDTDTVIVTDGGQGNFADAGPDLSICAGESVTLTVTGGVSYEWNNGLGAGSTHTVSPSSSLMYSVTATDASGCTDIEDVLVMVTAIPVANAGSDQVICEGEIAMLQASGGTDYEWSTGETTAALVVSPASTSTYTVTVSVNGCEDTDDVLVTVFPVPVAQISATFAAVCQGDSTILTASGGSNYSWSTGQTSQSIAVAPPVSTLYTVTVSDGICSSTASINIQVTDSVSISVSPATICEGETTTLTASGGSSFLWSTGETSQIISVTPVVTTEYFVTVSEATCTSSTSVTVVVNPLPQVTVSPDAVICLGESIPLSAAGGSFYEWSTGDLMPDITVSPLNSTQYFVTVGDAGCEVIEDVVVQVVTVPGADAGSDQQVCQGDALLLTASGGNSYLWSNGSGTQSITVIPNVTTTYYVTISDANCSVLDSIIVTVISLPPADAGADQNICEGETTTLSATGGTTYLWSTGAPGSTINVAPPVTSTYIVTVADNGCLNTDTVTVYVQTAIVASVTAAPSVICETQSTVLTASGGSVFEWNTGETTQSISITPQNSGYFQVTVTENSCTDTTSIYIEVLPGISVITSPPAICYGQAATITVSEGNSYFWSTGQSTQTITVSPSQTTTYSVTVSNAVCSDSTDILLVVHQLPNASAGSDTAICEGSTAYLNASGGVNYLWSNSQAGNSIEVQPTINAYYSVTVTDNNGCSNSDQVMVLVNPVPHVLAIYDLSICAGVSVQLFASGGDSYEWVPDLYLNDNTQQNPVSTPAQTITYTVIATNGYGCTGTDLVNIEVSEASVLEMALSGVPQEICAGESMTVNASVLNGGSTPSYSWFVNGTQVAGSTSTVTNANIMDGDTIVCHVISSAGCVQPQELYDTLFAVVHPLPHVNFAFDKIEGCVPLSVQFNNLAVSDGGTFLWEFSNGSDTVMSLAANPSVTFSNTGVYSASLTVTSNAGCSNTWSYNSLIRVYPNPVAYFTADPVVTNIFDAEIDFINESTGADYYVWDLGNGFTTNSVDFSYTYTESGIYDVVLNAHTWKGCVDSISAEIKINSVYTFYAPTAFTPNNYSGNNTFNVFGYGISEENFMMYIYDRWGEIVFKTSDLHEGWDGRIKKRRKGELGTYVWLVVYMDMEGNQHEKAGTVTLIR